jgi:hypothetical protein
MVELGHTLDLHVSVLQLPFVVGFEQHGSDQADDAVLVGKDADDIGAALHFLVQPRQRIDRVKLGAVLGREGHVGEHIGFGIVHEGCKLRPSGAELIGDMPPDLGGAVVVGLDQGVADGGRDHGVLAFGT